MRLVSHRPWRVFLKIRFATELFSFFFILPSFKHVSPQLHSAPTTAIANVSFADDESQRVIMKSLSPARASKLSLHRASVVWL
jgi:hypothetical protein